MRENVEKDLKNVRILISQIIGASSSEDVVFIENASDGFNTIVKNYDWEENDKILLTNISYGMVKNTVKYRDLKNSIFFFNGIFKIDIKYNRLS